MGKDEITISFFADVHQTAILLYPTSLVDTDPAAARSVFLAGSGRRQESCVDPMPGHERLSPGGEGLGLGGVLRRLGLGQQHPDPVEDLGIDRRCGGVGRARRT